MNSRDTKQPRDSKRDPRHAKGKRATMTRKQQRAAKISNRTGR